MVVRKLAVAAIIAVAVAACGLTACDTKVGKAAIVDGHRISESQVVRYLTPEAAAVSVQTQTGATGTIAPPAYVLNTLIQERVFLRMLASTKAGRPSEGEIAKATRQALGAVTVAQAAQRNGIHGFTSAFDKLWVRVQILGLGLRQAAQQGVDVNALIGRLHFRVTVNPRYGRWDNKILALSDLAVAGVPDFLSLDGVSSAPSAAAPAPTN